MTATEKSIEARIDRLHANGIVDLHFDMPMDLYEKRDRTNVLSTDYLPELEAGNIGVFGAAIYIEDHYLPEMNLRVALDQIARVYAEAEQCARFAICKSYQEILDARKNRKIALLITMEGVEPLGTDLTSPALGSDLLAPLSDADARLRRITGLTGYHLNLGRLTTDEQADVSQGFFGGAIGVTRWLTVFGRMPYVRSRVQAAIALDRLHARDSASATYARAADRLPTIGGWLRVRAAAVTDDLVREIADDELAKVRERLGEELWAKGRFAEARQVFEEVALSESFPAFLTLVAQRHID